MGHRWVPYTHDLATEILDNPIREGLLSRRVHIAQRMSTARTVGGFSVVHNAEPTIGLNTSVHEGIGFVVDLFIGKTKTSKLLEGGEGPVDRHV